MRVRIAVAVDDGEGDWSARGMRGVSDEDSADFAADTLGRMFGNGADRIVWIEADIPEPVTVEGEVKDG